MGQVGTVRVGGAYFREYAVEQDDVLIRICLRFGHTDWRAVYDHPANAAFKARFPDPDQIDFVNPVNLLIPLAGATTSGKSRRGRPIGDYYIARVVRPDGIPSAFEDLVLLGPGLPASGKPVTTTAEGDVIVDAAAPGDWFLVSASLSLVPETSLTAFVPSLDVSTLGTPPVLSAPVMLTRNAVDTLVAREVVCLRCPMCWTMFAVTVQSPSGTAYTCPNDGRDWTPIVNDIDLARLTFLSSPLPPQDPTATPSALVCRGIETSPLASAYGSVPVFWDESRFVLPDDGDYTLWGRTAAGTVVSPTVIGRHTWGAAPPRTGPGKEYKFHTTAMGAGGSGIYTIAIPSNEITPLTSVLQWITVHHTASPPQNSFATPVSVQEEHFIDIAETGPGADIGYHFIIDGDGKIYEGRPLGIKGSHVVAFNGGNVGIVLAGDFERSLGFPFFADTPTAAAVASLNVLVDALAARFGIRSAWWHLERKKQAKAGHTECPGARLIALIAPIRVAYPGPPP